MLCVGAFLKCNPFGPSMVGGFLLCSREPFLLDANACIEFAHGERRNTKTLLFSQEHPLQMLIQCKHHASPSSNKTRYHCPPSHLRVKKTPLSMQIIIVQLSTSGRIVAGKEGASSKAKTSSS